MMFPAIIPMVVLDSRMISNDQNKNNNSTLVSEFSQDTDTKEVEKRTQTAGLIIYSSFYERYQDIRFCRNICLGQGINRCYAVSVLVYNHE